MSKIYAFPCKEFRTAKGGGEYTKYHQGMELRDYFAGEALANLNLQAHIAKPAAEALAKSAYNIADAMMDQRKEK